MRFFVSCVIAAAWQMVGIWGWLDFSHCICHRSFALFLCNERAPLLLLSYFWDVCTSLMQECGACTRPLHQSKFATLCVSSYTSYCVRARLSSHTQTHAIVPVCVLAISLFARATEHDSLCACEERDAPIRFSSRDFSSCFLFVCSQRTSQRISCAPSILASRY